MLRRWLSHRPLQLISSSSSFSTTSGFRGLRVAKTPKRLRDRINYPGIGTSQFILKRKDTARRVKVNRFLLVLNKYLERGEWKAAWDSLHRKLEFPAMGDSKTRFDAYEHAVTLFSSYERLDEARDIQMTMMNEGFIPSISLRTRMASAAVLTQGAGESDLLELLQAPLSDSAFTELALLQLIRFLGDIMDFSPSGIDYIVRSWVKLHGQISQKQTLSYLIQTHVKHGRLEDAKAWLKRSLQQGTTADASPFTDLITGFLRREHTDQLSSTIGKMRKANVAPDLAVFNAVIFGHINRMHFKDALATYHLLFQSRGGKLTPDKYTFTNMLNMYFKSLKPEYKVWSAKRVELIPARELYRDLIECHLIRTGGRLATGSDTLTTHVLNLALKFFLRTGDFEAAYHVFETFRICQVPANAMTARIVLKPLVSKIRKQKREVSGKDAWVRVLLGSEWYEKVAASGELSSLTPLDIRGRLWVVGRAGVHLDSDPQFSTTSEQSNFDDRIILTGQIDKLAPTDTKVLKGIVRRLFFARAPATMDSDDMRPTGEVWAARLKQARTEMMPDVGAMKTYFLSGRGGEELKRLVGGSVDRRKRYDMRYMAGG